MKYMVMECRLSYAIVLDEDGCFRKVANRNYEVGQTVTEVIEMQVPQTAPQKKKVNKWVYSLAAMAACLMLVVTSAFQMGQMTYASIYMTINPEVRIDVNRKDVVVGLEGVNADGEDLIEGYSFKKKALDVVMDELVDRAIEMDFLHEGGQITLTLDAESNEWIVDHGNALTAHLNEYLSEKISVTIEVSDKSAQSNQAVIPVDPGESDYGESDYGENTLPTQLPVQSEPTDNGYDISDSNDGQTDYGQQDDFDDGQTAYEQQDDFEDGQTDYGQQDDPADNGSQHDGFDLGDSDVHRVGMTLTMTVNQIMTTLMMTRMTRNPIMI